MYCGVPITFPASVRRWTDPAPPPGATDGVRRFCPSVPTSLANPKSATFTRPWRSSRMFSGLMSRWTIPWSWAYCSASQICGTMASASRGDNPPGFEQMPQVHPVHELHEEEEQPVGLAELVERDDAGMIELGQRLGFAGEAFAQRPDRCRCPAGGF